MGGHADRVAPLVVPIGVAFGVDPVHPGIVFLANLEIGYLTPRVGLDLFIASSRFGRPVPEVVRAAAPVLGVPVAGLLVITYVTALSTALPRGSGGEGGRGMPCPRRRGGEGRDRDHRPEGR